MAISETLHTHSTAGVIVNGRIGLDILLSSVLDDGCLHRNEKQGCNLGQSSNQSNQSNQIRWYYPGPYRRMYKSDSVAFGIVDEERQS